MKKTLLTILSLLSAGLLWANGDPVAEFSAMRLSRTPVAVHIPEGQLIQENLDITPMGDYTQVHVRYLLRNTSSKPFDNLPYGFPIDYVGQGPSRWASITGDSPMSESVSEIGWRDNYVRSVSFSLNSRALPWQCSSDTMLRQGRSLLTPEEEKSDKDGELWEERMEEFWADTTLKMGYCEFSNGLYRRWFYTTLHIGPSETVMLEVDYQIYNGKGINLYRLGQEFESKDADVIHDFSYDFSPASYWGNGKAECFEVQLHTDNIVTHGDAIFKDWYDFKGTEGLKLKPCGKNLYGYMARNFDLAAAEPLRMSFWCKPSMVHQPVADVLSHRIHPSQYKVTLSGSDKKYPAANLSDLDLSTATVLRADRNDSLYITIRFKDSMCVTGIAFYNGYCKDRNAYTNNSRVKSMLVSAVGRDEWGQETYPFARFEYVQSKEAYHPDTLTSAIPDSYNWQSLTDCALLIPMASQEVVVDDRPWCYDMDKFHAVKELRFAIASVTPGLKYNDLCISEIMVLGGPKREARGRNQ